MRVVKRAVRRMPESSLQRVSYRGLWEELVERLLRWVSYILTWRSPTPWSRKPKVHSTFNHPLEKSSVYSNRQQECLFKEVHPLLFLRIFFVIFILVIFFFIVVVVFCSSCSSFSSSSLYSLSSRTLSRPLLDYPHWKRNSGLYIPWVHNYGEVEWPPYASSHILVVRCKYSSAATNGFVPRDSQLQQLFVRQHCACGWEEERWIGLSNRATLLSDLE